MEKQKVPVSMRALNQRINRILKKENQKLKKYRGGQWSSDLGDWYIVDLSRNQITASHCDIAKLGVETGALKPHENLVEG